MEAEDAGEGWGGTSDNIYLSSRFFFTVIHHKLTSHVLDATARNFSSSPPSSPSPPRTRNNSTNEIFLLSMTEIFVAAATPLHSPAPHSHCSNIFGPLEKLRARQEGEPPTFPGLFTYRSR